MFQLSTAAQHSRSNFVVSDGLLMMLVESVGLGWENSQGVGGWSLLEQRLADEGLQAPPAQHLRPFSWHEPHPYCPWLLSHYRWELSSSDIYCLAMFRKSLAAAELEPSSVTCLVSGPWCIRG